MERQTLLASAAVLAIVSALAGPASTRQATAAQSVLGRNLIVDGNAEGTAGATNDSAVLPPAGWTASPGFTVVQYGTSGGFPGPSSPGPATRGMDFFAGGPNTAQSTASQSIDVSAGATGIRQGTSFVVSGYFGGYGNKGDVAVLTIRFLNAGGTQLGSVHIGGVTPQQRHDVTGLRRRSANGPLPAATRSIDVVLTMTRMSGSYDDGFADNLSLVLRIGKRLFITTYSGD
jgi:hypothetical protein